MSPADPQREFAVDVVRRLQQAGYTALWAGGCVRDLLRDETPEDYDVATDALPEQVRQLFGTHRTLAVGASFGVIVVRAPRGIQDVEVATFRTEGPYLDGRHPEHVAFSSPEEDAQRRDFTINGMFYDPLQEKVFDFVDGRRDLACRVLRAIGDPETRFYEDKLRMLRAVRMAAKFNFQLEERTADAIRMHAKDILVVSQERIAQELQKILRHASRASAVRLAHEVRLLTVILPELTSVCGEAAGSRSAPQDSPWEKTLRMLESLSAPSFEVAFAALLHEVTTVDATASASPRTVRRGARDSAPPQRLEWVVELCRRLRLSNKTCDEVHWLLGHRQALHAAASLPLSRLKRILAHPLAGELLALERAEAAAGDGDLADVEFCEEYLRQTPAEQINPAPLVTGDDLIRHGIVPGADFKRLLERARDAQLEGAVHTLEEALQFVESIRRAR